MNIRPPKVEAMIAPFMIAKALDNPRRYDIFHPSAWGSCLRKVAYQYYNEKFDFLKRKPYDVDLRMERIFDNGHGVHARWQDYLDNAGILRGLWRCPNPACGKVHGKGEKLGIFNPARVDPDFRCDCGNTEELLYDELTVESDPKYNFKGNVDAIVDVSGTKSATGQDFDVFVVDFKSMKDNLFVELDHPKWEHIVQTNIYMWLLDLPAAVVVYENKNDQKIKEMLVPRDESLIERIKSEAEWLARVLESGKMPPRPDGFFKSKFPCRFCEFVDHCFK